MSGLSLFGSTLVVLPATVQAATSANWWVNITNDRVDSVSAELAHGVDPNDRNAKGQPALMQAIRDGAWHVYDVLAADSRTRVNEVNGANETPLMYLALVGETKRAQALMKRGAQVNRLGWTPLQYAASTGKIEMAKMLIAHKAIVDAPAPDGTTALMMAAYAGSEPMVQLLLDSGAEVTTQNLQKQDAADWARRKGHDALAKKIDAIIQNTLKQRNAQRTRNRALQAQGQDVIGGSDAGEPVPAGSSLDSGNPSSDNPTVSPDQPAASPAPKKSGDDNSTSRYFDLDRFNKDATH